MTPPFPPTSSTLDTPTSQPVARTNPTLSILVVARGVTGIATLLAGLLAGFFVTYSISVTRGLTIANDGSYVEVMNAINATVSNPTFALIFFGAPASASLAALLHLRQPGRSATWACAMGAIALIACVAVTAGVNVPLNRALADTAGTAGVTAAEARAAYEASWNRANALRAVLSTLGFTALLVASSASRREATTT